MNKNSLIKSLDFILNKGFCKRTIYRAWKEFKKIKPYLAEEDSELIYRCMLYVDPDYPDYMPRDYYARQRFASAVKQAKQHVMEKNNDV